MSQRVNTARKYRREYLRQTGNYSICTEDTYFRHLNDVNYWKDLLKENWNSISTKLANKGLYDINVFKCDFDSKIEYLITGYIPTKYKGATMTRIIIGKADSVQEAYNIVCKKISNWEGSKILIPDNFEFVESFMKSATN